MTGTAALFLLLLQPQPEEREEPDLVREAVRFSVRLIKWEADEVDGFVEGDEAGMDGSNIHLDQTFGIDDFEDNKGGELMLIASMSTMDIRAWIQWGVLEFDETVVNPADFTFEGILFPMGDTIRGRVDIEYVRLGADNMWVSQEDPEDTTYSWIRAEGGFEWFNGDTHISSPADFEEADVSALFFFVGGEAGYEFGVGSVSIYFSVGPIMEWGVELQIRTPYVNFIAGWRYMNFDARDYADHEDQQFDVEIEGAYVGVEIHP